MNDIAGFALHNRNALKEITFGGTKEQWASVIKQDTWIHPDNSLTVHCTNGDITGSGEAGQEASTWPTIRGDVMYKQRNYIARQRAGSFSQPAVSNFREKKSLYYNQEGLGVIP